MVSRSTINVVQLGLGAMCIFFAYMSQGYIIEPTLQSRHKVDPSVDKHAGYYSQAIINLAFCFGNLVAAPILSVLGLRLSLLVGGLPYSLFVAGFLHFNIYYLYFSAALIGLLAGCFWTAIGQYIGNNSDDSTISRNSSLFWGLLTCSKLLGGCFILIVFGQKTEKEIAESTAQFLFGGFTIVGLIGVAALLLLPQKETAKRTMKDHKRQFVIMWDMLKTADHYLLALTAGMTGMQHALDTAIYSTCLAFTERFDMNTNQLMGFNGIAVGLGNLSAGFIFALVGKWIDVKGRWIQMWIGTTIATIAKIIIILNIPARANLERTNELSILGHPSLIVALLCGVGMGFYNTIGNSQMYAYVAVRYDKKESPSAYSLLKFWHAAMMCLALLLGSAVNLPTNVIISIVFSLCSAMTYHYAEIRLKRRQGKIFPDAETQKSEAE